MIIKEGFILLMSYERSNNLPSCSDIDYSKWRRLWFRLTSDKVLYCYKTSLAQHFVTEFKFCEDNFVINIQPTIKQQNHPWIISICDDRNDMCSLLEFDCKDCKNHWLELMNTSEYHNIGLQNTAYNSRRNDKCYIDITENNNSLNSDEFKSPIMDELKSNIGIRLYRSATSDSPPFNFRDMPSNQASFTDFNSQRGCSPIDKFPISPLRNKDQSKDNNSPILDSNSPSVNLSSKPPTSSHHMSKTPNKVKPIMQTPPQSPSPSPPPPRVSKSPLKQHSMSPIDQIPSTHISSNYSTPLTPNSESPDSPTFISSPIKSISPYKVKFPLTPPHLTNMPSHTQLIHELSSLSSQVPKSPIPFRPVLPSEKPLIVSPDKPVNNTRTPSGFIDRRHRSISMNAKLNCSNKLLSANEKDKFSSSTTSYPDAHVHYENIMKIDISKSYDESSNNMNDNECNYYDIDSNDTDCCMVLNDEYYSTMDGDTDVECTIPDFEINQQRPGKRLLCPLINLSYKAQDWTSFSKHVINFSELTSNYILLSFLFPGGTIHNQLVDSTKPLDFALHYILTFFKNTNYSLTVKGKLYQTSTKFNIRHFHQPIDKTLALNKSLQEQDITESMFIELQVENESNISKFNSSLISSEHILMSEKFCQTWLGLVKGNYLVVSDNENALLCAYVYHVHKYLHSSPLDIKYFIPPNFKNSSFKTKVQKNLDKMRNMSPHDACLSFMQRIQKWPTCNSYMFVVKQMKLYNVDPNVLLILCSQHIAICKLSPKGKPKCFIYMWHISEVKGFNSKRQKNIIILKLSKPISEQMKFFYMESPYSKMISYYLKHWLQIPFFDNDFEKYF